MKKKFSPLWKKSKQRRKQRKYIANAPLHLQRKLISTHLSKNLRQKYTRRSLGLRKGDTVKIVRGIFKGKVGKVEKINVKEKKVYITNIHILKKDGTKTFYPIHPSNLITQELILDDKKRQKILNRKK